MIKTITYILSVFFVLIYIYKKNTRKRIIRLFLLLMLFAFLSNFNNKTIINNNNAYLDKYTFNELSIYAQNEMKSGGIFASITLAQAAQESSLGSHVPGEFALFGIKAGSSWEGTKAYVWTTECDKKNNCSKVKAYFRTYSSLEEAFSDHTSWLRNTYSYRADILKATTVEEQLKALSKYATSQTYICNLINQINKNDLTKYDEGISYSGITGIHKQIVPSEAGCGGSSSIITPGGDKDINYSTSYGGDLHEGWIYNRLKEQELWKKFTNIGLDESNIDDTIKEIFNRARLSYENYMDDNSLGNIIGFIGNIDSGPYTSWRQCDSKWGIIHLGSSNYTICSAGCAATSVAIQIARSGVPISNSLNGNLNPGSFVLLMNKTGGFTSGGSFYWAKASTAAPNFKYEGGRGLRGLSNGEKINTIGNYLSSGNAYIVAHVNGSIGRSTSNHWVAITGVDESNIYMIDPASNSVSLNTTYGIKFLDDLRIYRGG